MPPETPHPRPQRHRSLSPAGRRPRRVALESQKALPQTPAPPIAGWPVSSAGVSGPFPPPALPGIDGTKNPSAPAPRIGTRLLRGLPLGGLPWRSPFPSRRQVPTFRTRASRWSHAVFMPVAARPVGRLPPSFVAGQQREPGFGDVPTLSTRQQRFTHVRLTSAHLTGLLPPFSATLTTSAIGPTQLAVVWTLILQSEPEGPTLISCAARLPGVDRYMTPSSRRRGAQLPAHRFEAVSEACFVNHPMR